MAAMSNQRTDIHSPVNMDPESYKYLYAYDSQAPGFLVGVDMDWWHSITSPRWSGHRSGQCDHCGAIIRYRALLRHLPTGEVIEVGETCLDNRFSLESKAQFDALRKAAALDRLAQRIKGQVSDTLISLSETQPVEVIEFLGDQKGESDTETISHIAKDIRRKFWTYGDISERQVAFVGRLVAEAAAKAQEIAERPAEAKLVMSQIPEGEGLKVNGEVVKTEVRDYDWGSREVMTVKVTTATGTYLVWGTVPSKLSVERGDLVSFTANVVAKDDGFAVFSRPRKATSVTPDPEEVLS